MARHLHEQSGGDPRDHGPVRELANEPPSPRADADFPDAPEPGGTTTHGDLTDEQFDDFARRLGLTDGDERSGSSGDDAGRPVGRLVTVVTRRARLVKRPVGRVLIVIARSAQRTGSWLHDRGERLSSS